MIVALLFAILLQGKKSRIKARIGNRGLHGEPIFLPCQTSHSRIFPKKHSFSYSYLTVGIPIGFEGSVGNLISVGHRKKRGVCSWLPTSLWACWFSVESGDYLERGHAGLGLRGRLNRYLESQELDPAAYPYAYLITAPRFMGYQFNPVSFWYLYDADRRLTAMILEVNNTFDERRMYFLTACKESTKMNYSLGSFEQKEAKKAESMSLPDQDASATTIVFRQSWPKDFHVSPFNSRKGSYTISTIDPLARNSLRGPVLLTITLLSSKNHPKLIARLASSRQQPVIDPAAMTSAQKLSLILAWGPVGFLTTPRIFAQAAMLYVKHGLNVWFRPEPKADTKTLGRHATGEERALEDSFRELLKGLVAQQAAGSRTRARVNVRYITAGGVRNDGEDTEEVFSSTCLASKIKYGEEEKEVEVRVLTPAFYSRLACYANTWEGVRRESAEGGTAQVSRPRLLEKLAMRRTMYQSRGERSTEKATLSERACMKIVIRLRGETGGGVSDLDAWVMRSGDAKRRREYWGAVLRILVAEKFTFGGMSLVAVVWFLMRACLAWSAISWALWLARKSSATR
ncbi:uncharacterized protein C8A04DRAFT_11668 [Dichotomopilus funicola]|uniref:DUF1365-domain-containing protein n=1 Tax=Dichotomopilus funicola TaxID=1934379 RepID=A0AAN6V3Q0_9PEZI|nr:hypothetical protein C8A04DRAFT_11668 [Dichotomopilus funicola]